LKTVLETVLKKVFVKTVDPTLNFDWPDLKAVPQIK
jgi:hypothetical protein